MPRSNDLKILPSVDSLPSIPLPNTAPAGPVSPCPRRSRNPTLNNQTETRSSSANGHGSRRKHGAVSAAPWRNTPSGPSCDRSPDDTFDWGCSSVDSGPRSSARIDCCRQRKHVVQIQKQTTTKGESTRNRVKETGHQF